MSESFEYEIRKDVRNNPIVREVDAARHRELWKSVGIVLLFIGVTLFAGLQRTALRQNGYQVQGLTEEFQQEDDENRRLKVEVEKLEAPERIEREARKQGFVPPESGDIVVIETVPGTSMPAAQPDAAPSDAMVARR